MGHRTNLACRACGTKHYVDDHHSPVIRFLPDFGRGGLYVNLCYDCNRRASLTIQGEREVTLAVMLRWTPEDLGEHKPVHTGET